MSDRAVALLERTLAPSAVMTLLAAPAHHGGDLGDALRSFRRSTVWPRPSVRMPHPAHPPRRAAATRTW